MLNTISGTFLILQPFIVIVLMGLIITTPIYAATNLKGRTLPIPNNPLTPPNQAPITSLSTSQIAPGLQLPKNLIVPTCPAGSSTGGGSGCPPIVGTKGPDIIIATGVASASIYGIAGNDVIQCGSGNCKVYSGTGDNVLIAGASTTAQFYGIQEIICSLVDLAIHLW